MARAKTVAEVVAGEAVSGTREERMADMRSIASVIANRAALLGVTPEDVVSNSREFNAYNKSLPPGVGDDIVAMAQEAIDYVAENGPVNNATFYATPSAVDNLPNGLSYEDATTGHQYFSDPQNRAIGTSLGYVKPNRYAYAQNIDVAGIPTPYAADDLTNNSLLSAFSATPTYSDDPFSAVLGGAQPPANQWGQMAAAGPIQAPMDSVTATGLLAGTPALAADAKANPMMSLAAGGLLGTNPALSANATVSGLPEVASVESRMGIADPGFDQSRFDGGTVSVASDFDPSRFSSPSVAGFDQSRFGPLSIDPATNTQSFMDQPAIAAAPADLGSFPEGYAAQRGPTTGLLSADFQSLQGNTERQLQNPASLAPMVQQQTAMLNVPAAGLLAGVPGFEAQASVPSIEAAPAPTNVVDTSTFDPSRFASLIDPATNVTSFADQPATVAAAPAIDNTVTGSVTPGLLSPTSIASANAPLSFTPSLGVIGAQPVQQNAFVDSFPSAVVNNAIEPATVNDVVAAPTLDTMQVADQPAVATVEGPATQPALDQQAITAPDTAQSTTAARTVPTVTQTQTAAKPSLGQRITNAINPGTIGGGLLGGLAFGPAGGLIGGLLGNAISQNGGLGGLLGGQPVSINNIGSSYDAVTSIWGGGQPVGTQATASDGQQVTSMPGGMTALTNTTGQTTVFDKSGKAMSYFGSGLSQDQDADTEGRESGGLFGGLFG